MNNIRRQLSHSDIAELTNFLNDPNRPDGTMCFQELQGFLFAVASAPEKVPPPDWLPIISDDEDFGFSDRSEAQHIFGLILTLYNRVNSAVLDRSNGMPTG